MRSSLTPRNERGTKLAVNMEQRRWTRFCACVRKLRTCTLRERSRRAARLTAAQCYDTATKPSRSARRVGHIYRCRLHTCTSRERPRTKAADSPRDLDMFEMKGRPAGMDTRSLACAGLWSMKNMFGVHAGKGQPCATLERPALLLMMARLR